MPARSDTTDNTIAEYVRIGEGYREESKNRAVVKWVDGTVLDTVLQV
ncbi:MAG: hypothetical protein GY842_02790 [bacterium]|nr:hypothetical protein [bacterium]